MIHVGGGYALGAGVDLGLDIQFIENDYGTSVAGTTEATSAGLVIAISFKGLGNIASAEVAF